MCNKLVGKKLNNLRMRVKTTLITFNEGYTFETRVKLF